MSPTTKLAATFAVYFKGIEELSQYVQAVVPLAADNGPVLQGLTESAVVLAVARNEQFLASLVASSVEYRTDAVRTYLVSKGDKEASAHDHRTLVALAKKAINYRARGTRIEGIFDAVFEIAPWPSETVKDAIVDLVLLRQIVVHAGDAVLDDYAIQIKEPGLFDVHDYSGMRVHHVRHRSVLLFFAKATKALAAQCGHIHDALSNRDEWVI